jgi:hypothetical protein
MIKLHKRVINPYFHPAAIKDKEIKAIPISTLKKADPKIKGITFETIEEINDRANIKELKTRGKYLDLFLLKIIFYPLLMFILVCFYF